MIIEYCKKNNKMSRTILHRQLGGHHWKNGVTEHLNQKYPRKRTIVCSYLSGWNYIIEDSPNNSQYLYLKTFHINYNQNNIDFDSPDFEQQLNTYINTNPLSVLNITRISSLINN